MLTAQFESVYHLHLRDVVVMIIEVEGPLRVVTHASALSLTSNSLTRAPGRRCCRSARRGDQPPSLRLTGESRLTPFKLNYSSICRSLYCFASQAAATVRHSPRAAREKRDLVETGGAPAYIPALKYPKDIPNQLW